ncbi:MAG: quinolinate synthase NadA [Methanomassiliicoccaceae archaeon]|jgi:quinolinate synthase|nr:quinolinate synthase NadA [Methanomassiliicoccaceae archaeon]
MSSLKDNITTLKKDRNALILAHNYCLPEVQDIADHTGDSLGLSIIASKADADVIIFCGVTFMAESAKVLNPRKKVLMPEPFATCPMASMCSAEQIIDARKCHKDACVVGYVNTTASAKAEMDICCTSSNAVNIVSSMKEKEIIFVPDMNLGSYVASKAPSKNIILWNGYCPVHQSITVQNISDLKAKYPNAVVVAHPECRSDVLNAADLIGSTEKMIEYAKASDAKEFIVATEIGMKHRLSKECPGKRFHFIDHALCSVMKMTTLSSVLRTLNEMTTEVTLPEDTMERAKGPLKRMIDVK